MCQLIDLFMHYYKMYLAYSRPDLSCVQTIAPRMTYGPDPVGRDAGTPCGRDCLTGTQTMTSDLVSSFAALRQLLGHTRMRYPV